MTLAGDNARDDSANRQWRTTLSGYRRTRCVRANEHFHPIDVPRLVQSSGIDGLLVLGAYLADKAATMLSRRPLVLVDGYSETPGRFATVVTDNVDGAVQATRRLIELGHRHIALVGTAPDAFPSIRERRQGYLAAIEDAGLEPIFVDGHRDEPDVVAAKLELDRSGQRLGPSPLPERGVAGAHSITSDLGRSNQALQAAEKGVLMRAQVGDRIVIRGHRVGEPNRDCEVLEARGADGGPPYLVRWADSGHESLFFPGVDAAVDHFDHAES